MTDIDYKESVRDRDGRKCVECGITETEHLEKTGRTLDVHRIVPGIDYQWTTWCVTLCRYCHGGMPRKCDQLIFNWSERTGHAKCGVFGVMLNCYNANAKMAVSDLRCFIHTLEERYGKEITFVFGDVEAFPAEGFDYDI